MNTYLCIHFLKQLDLLDCSLHFVYVGSVKGFTHWREGRRSGHEPHARLVNFLSN